MNNSKIFIGGFVFFALALVVYLFQPFLLNIFIAALLAVATSNIHIKIFELTHKNRTISAAITTFALFTLFIAPFLYAVISIASHAANFNIQNVTATIDYIKNYDFTLPSSLDFLAPNIKSLLSQIDIGNIAKNIAQNLANLGKMSAKFLTDIVIILIFFFFVLLYGPELINFLKNALPMDNKDSGFILSEVANVMSVVFYSTIANMIIQGMLFALVTMIYGYDGFLMGILFAFCSLIPVVGGLLAWAPISLYEFAQGNTTAAIVICIYTCVVISFLADNFVKPLVIKFINSKLVKQATNINEMLIFFAMIAGIATFGFWGIILGPAIVTFFVSTIKLYIILRKRHVV
ncbi:AI-2E family transporter [Campylobacter sp. 9BO]|uniref:AI-2E family transporter n=1 Tax=Campylobacter sp. 9BO TaxID=3424759 RepID=UPI003D33324B